MKDLQRAIAYVLTPPEALADWKSERLGYQWVLCYGDEIIDIDEIQQKLASPLGTLTRIFGHNGLHFRYEACNNRLLRACVEIPGAFLWRGGKRKARLGER